MIEVLPPFGKCKYNTWRILPVKCYIDNSVHLQSYIRNVNKESRRGRRRWGATMTRRLFRTLGARGFGYSSIVLSAWELRGLSALGDSCTDFSLRGLTGLSPLGDSLLAGTLFSEEPGLMS
jgi:hypothetical protein